MSEIFTKVENLAAHVREYVNTKIDTVKLNAADKSSRILSNLIAGITVSVVFLLFIVFVSIAAALALSAWLEKSYIGFLIIAAFYLLAGIIVLKFKERLIRIPIMNAILKQLFKDNEDEKD